jgi:O-antigen/teichoic acid export membrane protein
MQEKELNTSFIRKILKNFFWLFLQLGISRAFGFLFAIILARRLTQSDFGLYTYASSIIGIFLILSDLGLSTLLLREIARQGENASEIFGRIFAAKLPLALFAYIVFGIVLYISPPKGAGVAVMLLATAFFLESAAKFVSAPFKATEQMHYLAFGDFVFKLFLLAGAFLFLNIEHGLLSAGLIYMGGSLIYLLFYTLLFFKHFRYSHAVANMGIFFSNLYNEIRNSFPIALGGLIMVVYINTDILILRWLKGDAATGAYGVSYLFYLGLGIIPSTLVQAILPRLSASIEKNQTGTAETVLRGTVKLLFLISLPIALGGILLSRELITFFYGARYLSTNTAFRLFMLTIFFNYINTLFSYYLFAERKQREINAIYLASVCINIILNILLIPKYSISGAAFATLSAEISFVLIYMVRHPSFISFFSIKWIWRALLAASVMSAALYWARGHMHFLLAVLCGGTIYALLLIAAKTFKNEQAMLRLIMKGIRTDEKYIAS